MLEVVHHFIYILRHRAGLVGVLHGWVGMQTAFRHSPASATAPGQLSACSTVVPTQAARGGDGGWAGWSERSKTAQSGCFPPTGGDAVFSDSLELTRCVPTGLCQRRGWEQPTYECYREPGGYTCLVLVNGREYQTDLAYESDELARENAAMRAFMVCRNFSVNGGMLARNGIVQGLPADESNRKHRKSSSRHTSSASSHSHSSHSHGHHSRSRRSGQHSSGSSTASYE